MERGYLTIIEVYAPEEVKKKQKNYEILQKQENKMKKTD